ncbi:BNR repeat-like domain-containing protein [Aspergillus ambiguus]|uniref:sialidase family protein n=1 Tax=Aspergillus ambiguus TaxID=176160 RepID=UPI003CCE38AD
MPTATTVETIASHGAIRLVPKKYLRKEAFVPSATVQCHASSLLFLADGDLLCTWFGGTMEGKPDISIYMSRLRAGDEEWGPAQKMTHDNSRSEQNPLLFRAPCGDVWLLYTSQHAGNQDSAIIKHRISRDGGETWGPEEALFEDKGIFIRQPIRILDDDTWVLPVFKCRVNPGQKWMGSDDISCVRLSKDQGQSWTEIEVPDSTGCVHMAIQRLKDGKYLALFRSRWADNVYLARSLDGVTWSSPEATVLPNPNAGICFDVLPSGRIVLVYNHSSKTNATGRREGLYDDIGDEDDSRTNQTTESGKSAFWGAPRAPLCVAWSDDDGLTWKNKVLEDGDGFCMTNNSEKKLNRELSYPSMVVGNDGTLHIAFTFWRQRIKHVQLKDDFFTE